MANHTHNADQIVTASSLTARKQGSLRGHTHTAAQVLGSISGTAESKKLKRAMGRQHMHDTSKVS